ncbi:hypothetical protein V2A26_29945, partial [Pseudomonas aeruginosa]
LLPLAKRLGRVIYCANPRQISRRATGTAFQCLGGALNALRVGKKNDGPQVVRARRVKALTG